MIDPVEFGKTMASIVNDATAPLLRRIEELESRQPEKGEKGDPGQDAPPVEIDVAEIVKALLGAGEIKHLVELEVEGYLAENPPKPGADGAAGRDGEPGPKGDAGEKGADGRDGVGLAGAMIDRDGALVVTLTNGEAKSLGPVVGTDGKDGRDGQDGAGLVNLVRTYDAETHEIVERWGEKELRYAAGGIRPGGYWREGTKSVAGQVWNHAGVAWIAKRDTSTKPMRESPDWEIFANKGRDGQDGRDGRDLAPPAPVSLKGNDDA